MIESGMKSRKMKRRGSANISLRHRLEKHCAFLAILAVILNFLSPVTHGLISQADASEFLEICTQQGVQVVQIEKSADRPDHLGGDCDACPDCPVCPVAKSTFTTTPDQENLNVFQVDTRNKIFLVEKTGRNDPPWIRPALRAPPLV